MGVASRKRVYWSYFILAIIFLFFYLVVLENKEMSYNYNYAGTILVKILNANRILKISFLYLFIVSGTSLAGYVISRIVKAPDYGRSFAYSFGVSTLIGVLLFIKYIILK